MYSIFFLILLPSYDPSLSYLILKVRKENWPLSDGWNARTDSAPAPDTRALAVAHPLHLRAQDQEAAQLLGEVHRPVSTFCERSTSTYICERSVSNQWAFRKANQFFTQAFRVKNTVHSMLNNILIISYQLLLRISLAKVLYWNNFKNAYPLLISADSDVRFTFDLV